MIIMINSPPSQTGAPEIRSSHWDQLPVLRLSAVYSVFELWVKTQCDRFLSCVSQTSCHSTLWDLCSRKEAVKYKQKANTRTAASLFHMGISHRPRNVHPVAYISFSEFLLVQDSDLLCRTVTFCDRRWLKEKLLFTWSVHIHNQHTNNVLF